MKKCIALFLIVALFLTLCACSSRSLNGRYVSESRVYAVEFKRDGSCTWYQDDAFFNGTYQEVDGGWQLNILGNGMYSNTVFYAESSGKALVITGGKVSGETFTKQ